MQLETQELYNSFIIDSMAIWKLPLEEQSLLVRALCGYLSNHINYEVDHLKNKVEREEILNPEEESS